jgi:hypothetical protein
VNTVGHSFVNPGSRADIGDSCTKKLKNRGCNGWLDETKYHLAIQYKLLQTDLKAFEIQWTFSSGMYEFFFFFFFFFFFSFLLVWVCVVFWFVLCFFCVWVFVCLFVIWSFSQYLVVNAS